MQAREFELQRARDPVLPTQGLVSCGAEDTVPVSAQQALVCRHTHVVLVSSG